MTVLLSSATGLTIGAAIVALGVDTFWMGQGAAVATMVALFAAFVPPWVSEKGGHR